MVFHFRVVLDEIFGSSKYRNCITRKKCNPKNYTRKAYGNVADYILFYTKSDNYVWNRPHEPWTDERVAKEYQYVEPDTGRRYKKVPVHAPGVRHGETGKPWRGMLPPTGKHWQYPPSKLDELDTRGEIYWSPTGNPRRKVYLDESQGVSLQNIWMDLRDAHNQNIRITGYPTEKNPDLLRKIILASSNPGDLVLDCFSGSGTTLAAASELGRRWIGVDNSPEAIRITLKRFAVGLEPMGDYVSEKLKTSTPALLPLFDERTQKSIQAHAPIEDFTLYAELSFVEELRSLLTENKHTIQPAQKERVL
jgi:adenine-specific DNA-methyltransferase